MYRRCVHSFHEVKEWFIKATPREHHAQPQVEQCRWSRMRPWRRRGRRKRGLREQHAHSPTASSCPHLSPLASPNESVIRNGSRGRKGQTESFSTQRRWQPNSSTQEVRIGWRGSGKEEDEGEEKERERENQAVGQTLQKQTVANRKWGRVERSMRREGKPDRSNGSDGQSRNKQERERGKERERWGFIC